MPLNVAGYVSKKTDASFHHCASVYPSKYANLGSSILYRASSLDRFSNPRIPAHKTKLLIEYRRPQRADSVAKLLSMMRKHGRMSQTLSSCPGMLMLLNSVSYPAGAMEFHGPATHQADGMVGAWPRPIHPTLPTIAVTCIGIK